MSQAMSHWTGERRAKQAALIRQVKPWQRSTGPRTPSGKAISSRNADKNLGWSEIKALRQLFRQWKAL